jgi:hypothetical protein
LAGIARLPEISVEQLITIPNIGSKKAQKYGEALVESYLHGNSGEKEMHDETEK